MSDIICTTFEAFVDVNARLHAEYNGDQDTQRRRRSLPASFEISVGSHGLACHQTDVCKDAREAAMFAKHVSEALEAMKAGREYFVSVYFDGVLA